MYVFFLFSWLEYPQTLDILLHVVTPYCRLLCGDALHSRLVVCRHIGCNVLCNILWAFGLYEVRTLLSSWTMVPRVNRLPLHCFLVMDRKHEMYAELAWTEKRYLPDAQGLANAICQRRPFKTSFFAHILFMLDTEFRHLRCEYFLFNNARLSWRKCQSESCTST